MIHFLSTLCLRILRKRPKSQKAQRMETTNIVSNPDFSNGLDSWHSNCCRAYIVSESSGFVNGMRPVSGRNYVIVRERTEAWQGLEQDISEKVLVGKKYKVVVFVGVSGNFVGEVGVQATVRLENYDSSVGYESVGRVMVSRGRWEKLEGSFTLVSMPRRVVFYLEGPNPYVELMVDSVCISCEEARESASEPHCSNQNLKSHEVSQDKSMSSVITDDEFIIHNPYFEHGLNNWSGKGCKIIICNSENGKIFPLKGRYFASAIGRSQSWNGIQQDVTGRIQRKCAYEVIAAVRISGNISSAEVQASLWVQSSNGREEYIGIAKAQASDHEWVQLKGKFLLNSIASKVVIYLEGPPPGTDFLVDSIIVKRSEKAQPSTPPKIEVFKDSLMSTWKGSNSNIITNHDFSKGLHSWSLNNCEGYVATDEFCPLKGITAKSGGSYAVITNRKETWQGLEQDITNKISVGSTYNVSAIVRIWGSQQENTPVIATVKLELPDSPPSYLFVGRALVSKEQWEKLDGTFSLTSMPKRAIFYLEGPSAGVDLLVDSVSISCSELKQSEVRKREIILRFRDSDFCGAFLTIRQTQNSFPLGSCITRSNIENEDFVDFFLKIFSWAVFENELKWYHTEPQQGNFNYKDADDMLEFCKRHGIQARGHCIFWDVEDAIQPWVRSLHGNDLMMAVENRLKGLITRYKGKFRHYDVNNEMLHGSFFQDRLGKDIRAYMFKETHRIDPSAVLFVNDYNIEDGCDTKSTPEKYINHILELQERGAPVGGIGIQGHVGHPVGEIICDSLDKLSILGLPIWFTEVDFCSDNEHVRAEDLEVVLREAFAHPAVEGIMLWGFWELIMCRDNSHLVNAEGHINEAGKRLLALKEEWLSQANGKVNSQREFKFRGFYGSYNVEITTTSKKTISRSFVVDKGDSPLVITIQ